MAALAHNTLPFWTKTGNKELFKDQPLTQVGLFTVTLDPRPSWPQLLLPNMKSFPFSVETKTEAPESVGGYLRTHHVSAGSGFEQRCVIFSEFVSW